MYVPRRSSSEVELQDKNEQEAGEPDADRIQEYASFLRRPSNTARIEDAAREYNFQAMKLLAADNDELLDREIMLYNLAVLKKRNVGLLSLPFTLIFFFSFAYSAFQHEDITNRYVIETGLTEALGSGAEDISQVQETWGWLNNFLFPALFNQVDILGNAMTDKLQWGRVLSYNMLVGPLFIEQERSPRALCEDDSDMAKDMYCYDVTKQDVENFGRTVTDFTITPAVNGEYGGGNVTDEERLEYYNSPFSASYGVSTSERRLRMMSPTYQDRLSGGALSAGVGQSGQFRALFFPNTPYHLLQERLNYLYRRQWLDKQTKHVTLYATLLNVEMGRPRLLNYMMTLSFARSGDVFTKLRMDTIFLEFWSGSMSMLADLGFGVMLLIVTVMEIVALKRSRARRTLLRHIKTSSFLLQVITIVVGWGIILVYQYMRMQTETLVKELEKIMENRQKDIPPEHNVEGAYFIDMSGKIAYFGGYVQIAVAQYHLPLMLRFFMAFRAQPRLGVVVNTLEACMLDILHFLVILLPSGIAYAISGCFIFGRRLEEFSDIKSAIGYCFKILTENEYDWPSLSEEHFWTTGIWVWSFMIFLAMIMLNMVLAIVLDVYSEQRKNAGKSEDIWKTVVSLWRIFRNRKTWVSVDTARKTLETAPRLFSKTDLQSYFPGMPPIQLETLVNEEKQTAANIFAGPEQMQRTMRLAMSMKVEMDKVSEAIEELHNCSYRPDPESTSAPLPDDHWMTEIRGEMARQNHSLLQMQWQLQRIGWQSQVLSWLEKNQDPGAAAGSGSASSQGGGGLELGQQPGIGKQASMQTWQQQRKPKWASNSANWSKGAYAEVELVEDPTGVVWSWPGDDGGDQDVFILKDDNRVLMGV